MMNKRALRHHSTILAAILALIVAWPVRAHPADMYFQEHALHLSKTGIQATWSIYPGGMLAPLVWSAADTDQNKTVTPAEARAWLESHLTEFSLSLDGTTSLAWRLEEVNWPTSLDSFLAGNDTIVVNMSAAWPANLTGRHQLILRNHYQEAISINWFSVQAIDGITFQTPKQQNGHLQIEFAMAEGIDPPEGEPLPLQPRK